MKKQLLLLAGGLLALASCNTATDGGASDAQVDSMVNERVEALRMEMMRQNDSLINAMAQIKADSIIAAMKGGSSVTTKTTTTRTTKVSGTSSSATTKDQPVMEKPKGTVSDRPGATNQGQGTVNDRPGATNNNKKGGTVSDRPGAN